ncbi:hypothetical protein [Nocardioides conyzicola]|uniref:Uncharacterized protein n=1 Tax=Nocardioides conyzicola TaxID=1651781 RepID=A0ABP8XD99_9ACTN
MVDALSDAGSDKVLRHPAVAGRIKRRPVMFRVGGGLVALGLVPVVATLGALLRHRYDPEAGVMPVLASAFAALVLLGWVILGVWWRTAEPDKPTIE